MTVNSLEHIKSNKSVHPYEQKAHIGYLAEYNGNSQYVIWVPSLRLNKLILSANVLFNESETYKQEDETEDIPDQIRNDDYQILENIDKPLTWGNNTVQSFEQ